MLNLKKDIPYLVDRYEHLCINNSARIKESLNLVSDTLHHKKVPRVPIWQISQTILFPRHEIFWDREKNLISQLANIVLTLQHKTDYVPYLDPFEGVTVLAEAFGSKVEIPLNGDPWIKKPIINSPSEVYNLKKPDKNNSVYRRVLETLSFFEKETYYKIPVGATDPQGPLDVASLIWDNRNFLISCIENKREVHYLLNLITDAFIEFYKMQYNLLKNPAFPVHSFPLVKTADGISISDDAAIFLSPELFEEFGLPYLNRISEAFGGLYYHSCGDYGHLLDKILTIKGLRAINGHLSPKEFKPEYISKVLSKNIGLFLGISDREIGWPDSDIWEPEEVFNIYDNYYIPNAITESKGKGIVLVGYGSYSGYIDLPGQSESGNLLVGAGGHTVTKSPLVNVSVEKKNENFDHIIGIIERYK